MRKRKKPAVADQALIEEFTRLKNRRGVALSKLSATKNGKEPPPKSTKGPR